MSDANCTVRESDLTCDGTRLHCRAIDPVGPTIARLAIIHGYGEHSGRYLHFMQWLAERGIASVTFDQRGHGLSTGRRGYVQQWEEYLTDVQAFLGSIESNSAAGSPTGGPGRSRCGIWPSPVTPGEGRGEGPFVQVRTSPHPNPLSEYRERGPEAEALPLFILGHSHGGLVCAAAAERGIIGTGADAKIRVRGCILSSPYLAARIPPPLYKRLLARATNHVLPWLPVSSGLQPHWLSSDAGMLAQDHADKLINRTATPRWFYTMRLAQRRVQNEAGSFKLPLLCLIGGADVIPDPAVTARFVEQSGGVDKSFYRYADRVHELLREVGREQVFWDIFGWIKARCL